VDQGWLSCSAALACCASPAALAECAHQRVRAHGRMSMWLGKHTLAVDTHTHIHTLTHIHTYLQRCDVCARQQVFMQRRLQLCPDSLQLGLATERAILLHFLHAHRARRARGLSTAPASSKARNSCCLPRWRLPHASNGERPACTLKHACSARTHVLLTGSERVGRWV